MKQCLFKTTKAKINASHSKKIDILEDGSLLVAKVGDTLQALKELNEKMGEDEWEGCVEEGGDDFKRSIYHSNQYSC